MGTYKIPTWTTPLLASGLVSVLIPNTSFLGHICGVFVGYVCKYSNIVLSFLRFNVLTEVEILVGLGYLQILVPPEKILRWIEGKLNLLGRLPHYVSVDQKTYGRYGLLPSTGSSNEHSVAMNYLGSTQRLGP